jgi:hypothetical protein
MTSKFDIEIRRVLFVGLCTFVFIMAGTMNGLGQDVSHVSSGQTESSQSQAAHDYCVQLGYMYKTTPSLNNGQPICEFTKTTWCDADAFYSGNCTASNNPAGLPNPYATYYSGSPPSASVHTPYGDIPANVLYGGNIYVNDPYYGGYDEAGAEQAAWMYGAMSFLNAP